MNFPKDLEFCIQNRNNNGCLNCPRETGKRPFDCRKYFGSDHLTNVRYKRFKCKSRRIRLLAQPKYLTPKFVRCPDEFPKNSVEISREFIIPTRIRMLAVPKVRKLKSAYEEYRKFAEKDKLENINNMLKNSMMTMYSRLANVHLLERQTCRKKWTNADWKRHCEWLKKRACPKRVKESKEEPRRAVPIKQLQDSIFKLSIPRYPRDKYRPKYGYQSTVKDSCKLYVPTKRLIKLAEPKHKSENADMEEMDDEGEQETFYVSPNALTYNASDRIKQLATPKKVPQPKMENIPDMTKYGVIERALKASLSERTIELSKPKLKDDDDDEERPLVNPKALKAKPTPRILELAKPRAIP